MELVLIAIVSGAVGGALSVLIMQLGRRAWPLSAKISRNWKRSKAPGTIETKNRQRTTSRTGVQRQARIRGTRRTRA